MIDGVTKYESVYRQLAEVKQQRAELLAALKAAKDVLEHMWREVSMNEYDYEKLNEAIINSDSAITKAEQDLSGETNVL